MKTVLFSSVLLALSAPAQQGVVGPTYRFADFDRDGLTDVYAVRPNTADRLFKNLGDGTFVDVSDALGLAAITGSRLALWQDYDGDAWPDLYVSAQSGRSRLLRNDHGRGFVDTTLASGVAHRAGAELFAEWVDLDLDGWADLHIVLDSGDLLLRNVAGRFERIDLPGASELDAPVIALSLAQPASPAALSAGAPSRAVVNSTAGGPSAVTSVVACMPTLRDAVNGACIAVSTAPTLGALYPLSQNLNVTAAGNVGVGTTSPATKLDVTGDVRASGQLVSSAVGIAPMIVSSTNKVTNFNADQLDGFDSSAFTQLGQTIESAEITDGTIATADLAASSVTSAKIAANAITSALLADGTITSADVAADTLTAADIASGAVTTAEILDGTIATADIASGAVTSAAIADGTISAADLALGSVTSAAIADGSIVSADLAGAAITGAQIADGTVATADLADGAVSSIKIADGSIAGADVAPNAIDAAQLASPLTAKVDLNQGSSSYSAKVSNTGASGIRDGLRVEIFSGSGYAGWIVNNATTGTAYGVRAQSDSTTARACFGEATTSGATVAYGVYGVCHNTSAFGVFSDGDFGGTGAKFFIQPHPDDPSKQVNFACLEGNESGTYFRGSIAVVGGVANVVVPESFRLVTEPDSLSATATPVGAPAVVWIESQSLERVIVRSNVDVTVNYVVNGTRRGFRGLETIRENTAFVPEYRGLPFGLQLRPEQRALLVRNGILNADFTPNEATARRLGWELKDPWSDEHAEPLVRELIRAGLVRAPAGWMPPSQLAGGVGAVEQRR
jgi:hypothetical protein